MAYINIASLTKKNRAAQIITDIGSNGLMNFYSGSIPVNPDFPPVGTLLAVLPLSTVAAVASLALVGGTIITSGSGGTDGVYSLVISGGGGSGAAGNFTVFGGSLSSISISDNGNGFTSPPTFTGFTNAGISGAAANAIMTGILVFNPITSATAIATGTAGFVRVTNSTNVGIIDLDVGTTNAFSVVMNSTFINSGGLVSCTADVILEA
jgi:hypothetical protein